MYSERKREKEGKYMRSSIRVIISSNFVVQDCKQHNNNASMDEDITRIERRSNYKLQAGVELLLLTIGTPFSVLGLGPRVQRVLGPRTSKTRTQTSNGIIEPFITLRHPTFDHFLSILTAASHSRNRDPGKHHPPGLNHNNNYFRY